MDILKVNNISKTFTNSHGKTDVLRDISFTVGKGEILGIRGENGAGKTTLFNIISGIEPPSSGMINFPVCKDNYKKVGVVFQNYSDTLLPWYTIEKNIKLPLAVRGLSKTAIQDKFDDLISRPEFKNLPTKKRPHQLSGGQKQKASIARALMQEPELLILDEPYSNLDFNSVLEFQDTIKSLHSNLNIAILIVAHNIDHVLFLANRILSLKGNPATIVREFQVSFISDRKKEILITEEFSELRKKILDFEYEDSVC